MEGGERDRILEKVHNREIDKRTDKQKNSYTDRVGK